MIKIYQVDSFTNEIFKGNPAGVCIINKMPSEEWMLYVAAEMNLSETAFVVKQEDHFDLKWFTPTIEIDLCGHATLAAAHILWSEGYFEAHKEIYFHTKSGVLKVMKKGDWLQMDFPKLEYHLSEAPKELIEGLNVVPLFVGKSKDNYLIEIDSEEIIKNLKPDFGKLALLDMHAVIVTSKASVPYDFVSRFFAPGIGINEDPVTGSAHCTLANYWRDVLGKNRFMAFQYSARGGELQLEINGERVMIMGQAVTVLRGELLGQ